MNDINLYFEHTSCHQLFHPCALFKCTWVCVRDECVLGHTITYNIVYAIVYQKYPKTFILKTIPCSSSRNYDSCSSRVKEEVVWHCYRVQENMRLQEGRLLFIFHFLPTANISFLWLWLQLFLNLNQVIIVLTMMIKGPLTLSESSSNFNPNHALSQPSRVCAKT